jgi:hypothetical protein
MHGGGVPYRFQLEQVRSAANRVGRIDKHYDFVEGKVVTNQINAGWQLKDAHAGDGGFLVLPGSHRAFFPMPSDRLRSMDCPLIVQPPMNAGDVALFLGGSVGHGGAAWVGEGERRTVIQFYGSRASSLSVTPRGELKDPLGCESHPAIFASYPTLQSQ